VSEEGSVSLADVIKVLRAYAVAVTLEGDEVTVSRGKVPPLVIPLPKIVHRKTLHRLASKFDIPIHLFWNPEQIPKA